VIAVHDTPHDPNVVPGGCSGSPPGATRIDPAGFAGRFAPGLAALLAFALLQARRRRRAEAEPALTPGWATAPPMLLSWRVGVAATTAGVFVLVVSIPVPLLGPGTASAVSPASVTYFHGDHLGSSVVLTAEAASPGLLRHVLYRPYGGVVAETAGGSSQPPEVGFTGQRFEEAAGIYDYGARWYDPNLGRFLQPDRVVPEPFNPQSLNRYSYTLNDPVNRVDPTGQSSIFSESSYYGGSSAGFPQPPWGRSIDLGPVPFDPAYWLPDAIFSRMHTVAPSQEDDRAPADARQRGSRRVGTDSSTHNCRWILPESS
jgi:RHS repeat-associated protein